LPLNLAEFSPVIIFVLFGALVIAFIIIAVIQAAKRREAWRALARRIGCSYSCRDRFAIPHSYPQSLFDRGHGRRAHNVLHGQIDDNEIKCFDYLYKTTSGTGKNRHEETHRFSCLLLTPPIPFKPLSIRPETFFDRVGEFLGLDDIDFESDEFSRRFFVKCRDKRFAYDIIHARTMALLLECGKIYVEAKDDSILFYYSGLQRVPDEVEPLIRRGLKFLDLVPDYLIEQVRGRL